jgi:hypothetical protein
VVAAPFAIGRRPALNRPWLVAERAAGYNINSDRQ